jgi:broad specificity phosphatase PhoE
MGTPAPGVLLARHGETDDNVPPLRFQGWRDTPLNQTGRRQAHDLARRAAELGVASLFSSDLSRARETAQIVGQPRTLGGPPVRRRGRG